MKSDKKAKQAKEQLWKRKKSTLEAYYPWTKYDLLPFHPSIILKKKTERPCRFKKNFEPIFPFLRRANPIDLM